jgi:hypothetical protein
VFACERCGLCEREQRRTQAQRIDAS